jgi:hypothetical protein
MLRTYKRDRGLDIYDAGLYDRAGNGRTECGLERVWMSLRKKNEVP